MKAFLILFILASSAFAADNVKYSPEVSETADKLIFLEIAKEKLRWERNMMGARYNRGRWDDATFDAWLNHVNEAGIPRFTETEKTEILATIDASGTLTESQYKQYLETVHRPKIDLLLEAELENKRIARESKIYSPNLNDLRK